MYEDDGAGDEYRDDFVGGAPPEEIISSNVQLDNKFITPEAPKRPYHRLPANEQITRDLVLSNLQGLDALRAEILLDILAHIDNIEDILDTELVRLRNVFATELHALANVSRARDGFTAQLYKTQRVEHLSGEAGYYFGYRRRQNPNEISERTVRFLRKFVKGR